MTVKDFAAKLVLFIPLVFGCASASPPKYSVEALPRYDALFCREKGWTGADAVYSAALSHDVTLWLFGDTWIGDIVDGKHKGATMVNNSIALQRGKDPVTASVEFFWQTTEEGKPAAFIEPADGTGWFWIFDGIVADGKLYLFLSEHLLRKWKIHTISRSNGGLSNTKSPTGAIQKTVICSLARPL
jgi:hypothetical protein